MEIHPHIIGQSSPHHVHHHGRYTGSTNDYYLGQPQQQQQQYSNGLNDPQFDFQQQMLLGSSTNDLQAQIKNEHIKLESYGSPTEASPVVMDSGGEGSPSKMPNTSPSLLLNVGTNSGSNSLSPPISMANGLLNYAAAGFPPQLANVLVTDSRTLSSNASKHDRKRPYPCAMCSSRFGSKMELEEHQNSHTGQKPFECDICQSRFNRRSTLWNHKRIHSDAKPFSCTVCQMTFKWKNSLKCHKEMHMRKNETTSGMDNDIKLLTYATAAKKKMAESSVNGLPPAAAIQTVASRKKPSTASGSPKKLRIKREQLQEQTVSTTTAGLPLSLFGGGMDTGIGGGRNLLNDSHQQQQDSQHLAITHTNAHQSHLDLSQFNHNNLLMQAIYSNNTNSSSTLPQQQLSDDSSALDLMNSSSSTNNSSAANLNLDLLPAQQSLFLDNSQFLQDAATMAMHGSAASGTGGMRLPSTFPMNILDFQQQLTDRQQQQQLPYIQSQPQQQQQSMLNYPQRNDQLLLDDMQSLYQHGALDPSLLLHSHQQHHQQQPSAQLTHSHQSTNQQAASMDQQFSDFMLNGTPVVYPFTATHNNPQNAHQHGNVDGSVAGVSLCNPAIQQQQPSSLHGLAMGSTNMAFANQGAFNFMDEMQAAQISQEELQHLAKMLPYENATGKW